MRCRLFPQSLLYWTFVVNVLEAQIPPTDDSLAEIRELLLVAYWNVCKVSYQEAPSSPPSFYFASKHRTHIHTLHAHIR